MESETKDNILYERIGSVGVITLNRPEKYNSFDIDMMKNFHGVLEDVALDKDIRAVLLTGAGNVFSVGVDLAEMKNAMIKNHKFFFREVSRYMNESIIEIRRMHKPVIAAINGMAVGIGFNISLACDLRIASSDASFKVAYLDLGLVPSGGCTCILPNIIGLGKTMQLILLNEIIDAEQAESLGIVNIITPSGTLKEAGMNLAERLAMASTYNIWRTKRVINENYVRDLEAKLENERRALMKSGTSEDLVEGVNAFLEKRQPNFSGKQ